MGPFYPRQLIGLARSCKIRVRLAQTSQHQPNIVRMGSFGNEVQKSLLLRGRRGRAERVQALLRKQ